MVCYAHTYVDATIGNYRRTIFVSSFYVKITGTQALACSVGHIALEQFAGGLLLRRVCFLSVLFYFFDTALFFILMSGEIETLSASSKTVEIQAGSEEMLKGDESVAEAD